MSRFPSSEAIPLRERNSGPPDVYPQRQNQLEDALTEQLVKDGFKYRRPVSDEYRSERLSTAPQDLDTAWDLYCNVLTAKAKAAPSFEPDEFQIVMKGLSGIDKDWDLMRRLISDLSGTNYNRKTVDFYRILTEFANYRFPLSHALRLINKLIIHTTTPLENLKKKQKLDPTLEWTKDIIRLLDNLFNVELINAPPENMYKEWDYGFGLLTVLYDSDLIEHWDVLNWLASKLEVLYENVQKCFPQNCPSFCSPHDRALPGRSDPYRSLKFVLPYFHRFCRRITESELVTRRVIYWASSAFSDLYMSCKLRSNPKFSRPEDYVDFFVCAFHRPLLLSLGSIVISLTLECPSAAVWNKISSETSYAYLNGSPLDPLPCPLSCLPIAPGPETPCLRRCLLETEDALLERGRLAESGWGLFPLRPISSDGSVDQASVEMFVRVLDRLDSYEFYNSCVGDPIETLFKRIFEPEVVESPSSLYAMVTFLCQWAVSSTRPGLYRSIYVAYLLDLLRSRQPSFGFQACLLAFLDRHAPSGPTTDSSGFRSLVCLFGELIDRGLFNYDAFVCTYIARGVFESSSHPLTNSSASASASAASALHSSLSLTSASNNFSVMSEVSEDNDRNSLDNPDSVRSDLCGTVSQQQHQRQQPWDLNRYLQYLIHFPLPQDESYTHEQNQRAQLLYGSNSRANSRAREIPRKVLRDITKLYTKSAYRLDIVNGELGKRRKNKDRNCTIDVSGSTPNGTQRNSTKESRSLDELIEAILVRFRRLSYYDMEYVISNSLPSYLQSLSGSTTTRSGPLISSVDASSSPATPFMRDHVYFPALKSLFMFFDVIEMSLDIIRLLEVVVTTLEHLQIAHFSVRHSSMNVYISSVWIRAIGILQTYHAVVLAEPELLQRLLSSLVQQLRRTMQDTSACAGRRSVWEYFVCLYNSSSYVKNLMRNTFDTLSKVMQNALASRMVSPLHSVLKEVLALRDPEQLAVSIAKCVETATWDWLPTIVSLVNPSSVSSTGVLITDLGGDTSLLDDTTCWDGLASLIGSLLLHECIDTEMLFEKLINSSLALGVDQTSAPIDPRSEPTVRLVCHILHRLFTVDGYDSQRQQSPFFRITEPHLLSCTLRKVSYTLLIDTLKLLMIHSNKGWPLESTEDGDDGSASGSDDNFSDNDRDSDRDTDDGFPDNSQDFTGDGCDLIDGLSTLKKKGKRRRVHLGASKNKRRRVGQNARRGVSVSGSSFSSRRKNRLASCIHPSTCSFLTTGQPPSDAEVREMPLRDFAHLVLREICVTPWVRENFYRLSTKLLQENVLIDEVISGNQTRFLLHIMYHPHDVKWVDLAASPDKVADGMLSLISNVNIWSLHSTLMELNLLCRQVPTASYKEVFDMVASRIVESFNRKALACLRSQPVSASVSSMSLSSMTTVGVFGGEQQLDALPDIEIPESDSSWLLPTLIGKLPHELRMQIVTKTCNILNEIKQFWRHKNDEDQERIVMQNSVILAHPVFSSILHVCMETVDPLERLYEQLEYFVSGVRETRDRMPENLRTRRILQECLALRLSLLGICFSSMNLNTDSLINGALILAQLIGFGVTEPHSNQTLFYTCLDMLHSLVHNLIAQVGPENHHYQKLAKNVRKKLADRHFTVGIDYIRPLLFVGRNGYSFVAINPLRGTAGAGNRIDAAGGGGKPTGSSKMASSKSLGKAVWSGFSSRGGGNGGASGGSGANNGLPTSVGGGLKAFNCKRGYKFTSRDRFVPWDIYDPNRRSTYLAMCGAVQVSSAPSRIEEHANLLVSHEHPATLFRSDEFYLKSLFPDPVEPSPAVHSPSTQSSASPASSSADPTSKNFILGPVPSVKRHMGSEVASAVARRMASASQQLPQRMIKQEDMIYRQSQQQIRATQNPQQMQQQPVTKRKRSRTTIAVQQQQQEDMQRPLSSMQQQMYHHQSGAGMYPPPPPPPPPQSQSSNASAMAAAQAAESAAAATAAVTASNRRKRVAGGGMAAVVGSTMRRAPPTSYDNGTMGQIPQAQVWSGAVRPPSSRMPQNQHQQHRQNLSEFVQSRSKAAAAQKVATQQQQQMATAFASTGPGGAGSSVMSNDDQFAQQQQEHSYGFPDVLPPGTQAPSDFLSTDRRQQQRYSSQSQIVPDPPPYPTRVQPPAKGPPQNPLMMQRGVSGSGHFSQGSDATFMTEAPRAPLSQQQQQQQRPHYSRLYDGCGGSEYR